MDRFERLHYIQTLDPRRDYEEICRLVAGYEFPWDTTRALELALFRTFCVPSIGELLHRTGEFHHRPQKRYDDTGLIVSQLLKWGISSAEGQGALQRMNHIHGYFPIANSDYLYVLSSFIYEPVRWIERFGWRPLDPIEKQALFEFWAAVGRQMGIQQIPATFAAFEHYSRDYEQRHFRYTPATAAVGASTLALFLSWVPTPLRWAARPAALALMDEPMLRAFGLEAPPLWLRRGVEGVLRSQSHLRRHLPPRRHPDFYVDAPQRSYPDGFTLQDIGPPSLLERLNEDRSSNR